MPKLFALEPINKINDLVLTFNLYYHFFLVARWKKDLHNQDSLQSKFKALVLQRCTDPLMKQRTASEVNRRWLQQTILLFFLLIITHYMSSNKKLVN